MKILNLQITGFKVYTETQEFDFGMVNQIMGGKDKGKTSLCESIVWCLKGCDLSGNSRGITKRLKSSSKKETKVTVFCEVDHPDGSSSLYEFSRVCKGRTTLYLNDKEVEQADFDSLIGQTDIFLSIFLPGYIGDLAPAKLGSMLLILLTQQDHRAVLESLPEEDQQRLRIYSLNDPLLSLQTLIHERNELEAYSERIKKDANIIKMSQAFNGGESEYEADNKILSSLRDELASVMGEEEPSLHADITEMEEQLSAIGSEYKGLEALWLQTKQQPLLSDNLHAEICKRSTELEVIKAKMQKLLERGFVLREEVERFKKHFQEDQADFRLERNHRAQQIQIEIHKLENQQTLRKNSNKQAKSLPGLQHTIDECDAEHIDLSADISAIRNYMLRYAYMQVEVANRAFNHAEILLIKKRAGNGDISLQYKLLYNKKEYYLLSNEERICCSIELAVLVQQVQGKCFPIFADDSETILEDISKSQQIQFFVTTTIPHAALSFEVVVA